MSDAQIAQCIGAAAARSPSAPAITAGSVSVSYGELAEMVTRVGDGLRAVGLERGQRVAIFLDKRIEAVVAIFATSVSGGVFVPINPVLRAHQVAHILRDSGATILVTSQARWQTLALESSTLPNLATVVVVDEPSVSASNIPIVGWTSLPSRTSGRPTVIDADLAALMYTSGSSGSPKGVALTHRNLVAGARAVSDYLHNDSTDVILAALPLSFDAGFSQLTTAFSVGAHVVLHEYLLPRDVIKACRRHGVTGLTCVPPLWSQLAAQSWGDAGTTLRYFASTGGRMPQTVLARLRAELPQAAPYLMYGLTEAFRSTYLDPAEIDRRPESIGKAIPNAEVLVLRSDGTECAPGEPGELVHRGALVALGYWNDPVRTAERFRPYPPGRDIDSWRTPERAVWSGDIVVRDDEGFLSYVGRADETIKKSGYRISPTELEEAAVRTGHAAECVALGRPDDALGHRIVLVVAGAEPAELQAALRKQLPPFMWPDEIVPLDELPRNANGKFDRALLREIHL